MQTKSPIAPRGVVGETLARTGPWKRWFIRSAIETKEDDAREREVNGEQTSLS